MNTQIQKSIHLPLMVAGAAAILLSSVAMAIVPIAGWLQNSAASVDAIVVQEQLPEIPAAPPAVATAGASKARVNARCDECGVIESMRRVAAAGNLPAVYEITVRMRDGSIRVNSEASPANWRPGERIILIAGGSQSGR